jgi:hypothetical protein
VASVFGINWSGRGWGLFFLFVVTGLVFVIPAVRAWPLSYPIAAIVVLWVVTALITGSANPFMIAVGVDGKLSASKFQFYVWTGTVVFSYTWITAIRALHTPPSLDSITDIPANLMYAMGFSIATLAGAKGITAGLAQSQRISKQQQSPTGDPVDLLATDDGVPDLAKIQMLVWTVIAIVLFIVRVGQTVHQAVSSGVVPNALPDIDTPLMVLMGLGHAAYLGNKLTSSDVPTMTTLDPTTSVAPCSIAISGSNLSGMAIVVCEIDGQVYRGNPINVASDANSISFDLPAAIGTHTLVPGDRVSMRLIVDGVSSANSLTFVAR